MRTHVYIDGFNLFYSVLSGTAYKWLDLHELFATHLIRPSSPDATIQRIKFFTAPVKGSLASDPRSEQRQAHYLRVLNTRHTIEIVHGFHLSATKKGRLQDSGDIAFVTVMEEKQTDVNIALHMYRDASRALCEQIVLCSNDSDLEPALQLIRQDYPDIRIGLVLPRMAGKASRKSALLSKHVDWTRVHIREEELRSSQFGDVLLDKRKRSIRCPIEW